MIVSCHQPNYLPWPGFFHKILKSDVHVILDTNQLPRGKDFVVRNKIKIDDDFKWLRVGVLEKNNFEVVYTQKNDEFLKFFRKFIPKNIKKKSIN